MRNCGLLNSAWQHKVQCTSVALVQVRFTIKMINVSLCFCSVFKTHYWLDYCCLEVFYESFQIITEGIYTQTLDCAHQSSLNQKQKNLHPHLQAAEHFIRSCI